MENLKEYLRKNNDGEYILEVTNEREAQEPHAKHWIEVPKGCDYLVSVFGVNSFIEKSMIHKIKSNKSFKSVLWQRDKEENLKEYLIKSGDGKYLLTHHDSIGAIEIPEGAIKATFCNGFLIFWKDNYSWNIDGFNSKKWRENDGFDKYMEIYKNTVRILWQRHTHPEELPFIDDEPSLNDKYAEIENVRQDIINSPIHYADSTIECIDAMEAMMTPEQFIGYLRGNVFKYQWRYEKKNGIEDLKKAQWYLERLTEKVAEKNAPF